MLARYTLVTEVGFIKIYAYVLSRNCPFSQLSSLAIVISRNCPFSQLSFPAIIFSRNYPFSQLSFLAIVLSRNYHLSQLSPNPTHHFDLQVVVGHLAVHPHDDRVLNVRDEPEGEHVGPGVRPPVVRVVVADQTGLGLPLVRNGFWNESKAQLAKKSSDFT